MTPHISYLLKNKSCCPTSRASTKLSHGHSVHSGMPHQEQCRSPSRLLYFLLNSPVEHSMTQRMRGGETTGLESAHQVMRQPYLGGQPCPGSHFPPSQPPLPVFPVRLR